MASEHDVQGDFTNTISRNFGFQGLYDDPFHHEIDHIEKLFSKLESQAARIISVAVLALNGPQQEFRLARGDLNALRKFLFVMGFRNSRRGQQFFENRFDAETRRNIEHHIATQNFPAGSTARDVWLQNLKEILVTDYWRIPENRRIFGMDRSEFVGDMRNKHIVFWRTDGNDEFITCNNGFGCMDAVQVTHRLSPSLARQLAEKVRSVGLLAESSLTAVTGDFQWSRLFPVHPKLTIALVHNSLSFPELENKLMDKLGLATASLYRDLPIPPPRRDNKEGRTSAPFALAPQEGSLHPAAYVDGQILESRVKDKFVIPLVRLSAEQTHRVNGMFLENVADTLAFRSPGQLYRSILAYERNTVWEHKRAYDPLKRALRAWALSSPSPPAFPSIVDTGERRVIWVASGERSTSLKALVHQMRAARREGYRNIIPPASEVWHLFSRTHDDSIIRNEEAHRESWTRRLTDTAQRAVKRGISSGLNVSPFLHSPTTM
ncbi:hypothetical protein AURDEDRAFT_172066 [Auricularia subglabra TFB-10046 SS5]|nr:hypothetical protein AURDEDRAFT_172066 [Auricularia subglabra TFB-10046 SS5]